MPKSYFIVLIEWNYVTGSGHDVCEFTFDSLSDADDHARKTCEDEFTNFVTNNHDILEYESRDIGGEHCFILRSHKDENIFFAARVIEIPAFVL